MDGIMIENRLPQLLSQRNMSIRELSRQTGVTYTTIWALYHMERRSLQFAVLESICRILGVQPGDIYTYSSAKTDSLPEVDPDLPITVSKKVSERRGQSPPTKPSDDWRNW